jgi:hypothetical protein
MAVLLISAIQKRFCVELIKIPGGIVVEVGARRANKVCVHEL